MRVRRASDAQLGFSYLNCDLGMTFCLWLDDLGQIHWRLDQLDGQKRRALANGAEYSFLILMPPAKDQVGIDVMFASDQRHRSSRREGGFDDLAFKVQRKVGAATGSTGWGNCIQNSVHYLG